MGGFMCTNSVLLASYPRNLVPGGPSWRILLTRLSPSLRGGGALGRCSLLSHDRASADSRGGGGGERAHTVVVSCTATPSLPVATPRRRPPEGCPPQEAAGRFREVATHKRAC